jgi:4a-hydroxytetrahydrobiopterin dehydratase
MTEILAEKACTPCRGGIPPLGRDEALRFQKQAPDWELRDEARRIERTFRFHNFQEALAFVQQVGELAEGEGHHPDISFGWGSGSALAADRARRATWLRRHGVCCDFCAIKTEDA